VACGAGCHNEAELGGVRLGVIVQHRQVEHVRADFHGGYVDCERRHRSFSVREYGTGE